jgi:hypothetical protein
MLLADFSDPSMWMTEFSVTHMFWPCVTLGFLTVYLDLKQQKYNGRAFSQLLSTLQHICRPQCKKTGGKSWLFILESLSFPFSI